MAVKLKDVAAKAGVSATTCSLILNNKPISVSDDTRKHVISIAQEMGYIRKSDSKLFGMIVPDLGNLYYAEIARQLSHIIQKAGCNLMILDSNRSQNQERLNLQQLQNIGVNGIILSPMPGENTLDQQTVDIRLTAAGNIPIILFDNTDPRFGCHSVIADDFLGGYLAAKHLIDLGHTKIGCIVGDTNDTLANRYTGFNAALAEAGISVNQEYMTKGSYTVECGYSSAPVLLEKGVTAIFAGNDMIAIGIFHYAKEHNIRIPDDLSIIGYDNIPIISTLGFSLTTVAQPIDQIAQRCMDFISQANQISPAERITYTFEPELVVRGSTGPCPNR